MRLTEAMLLLLAAAPAPAPGADEAGPGRRTVAPGSWGGAHARLVVEAEETRLEVRCAHGVIAGPLQMDAQGRVDSMGSFTRRGGGPGAETDAGAGEPARFRGRLAGKTLTLTVTLVGEAQDVGTFRLRHGRTARIRKCP